MGWVLKRGEFFLLSLFLINTGCNGSGGAQAPIPEFTTTATGQVVPASSPAASTPVVTNNAPVSTTTNPTSSVEIVSASEKPPALPASTATYNVKTAFHAYGDNTHDDTAAINAAILAVKNSGHSGTVFFPKGQYCISGSIVVAGLNGLHFLGSGYGTQLMWYANPGCKSAVAPAATTLPVPVQSTTSVGNLSFHFASTGIINISSTQNSSFGNFMLTAEQEGAVAGIRMISSSGNQFNNFDINGKIINAFQIGDSAVADTSNGSHIIDSVNVTGFSSAGFLLYGRASTGNQIVNSFSYPNLQAAVGTAVVLAGMIWNGGGGGSAIGDTDFYIAGGTNPIVIKNGTWETTPQFLRTEGPSNQTYPLQVISNRVAMVNWAATKWNGQDNPILDIRNPGPSSIIENIIALDGSPRSKATFFRWNPECTSGLSLSLDFSKNIVGNLNDSSTTANGLPNTRWETLWVTPGRVPTGRDFTQTEGGNWEGGSIPYPLPPSSEPSVPIHCN